MSTQESKVAVLWVDDEIKKLVAHIIALESDGFIVTTAVSTETALHKLEGDRYSVVITDLLMPPPSSAISFLKDVHERYPEIKLVVISGYLDNDEYRRGLSWLERDMDVMLIEKPLPEPETDAFETIKNILRGNITNQDLEKEHSTRTSARRLYEALEVKPGIFGIRFDVKKYLKRKSN